MKIYDFVRTRIPRWHNASKWTFTAPNDYPFI